MNSNLQPQENIDIQQYWLMLKRRWLPISIITASVITLAGVYVFNQKPVYETEGKLRFDKTNGASSLTGLTEQLGQLSGLTQLSNPLETEAEVIRSYNVVQQTISDLNLKDAKGKLLKVEDFTKILKVKSLKGTDVLVIGYSSKDSQEAANVVNKLIDNYLKNNIDTNRAQAKAARVFLSKQLPEVEQQVSKAEDDVRKFKEQNKVISLPQEAEAGVDTLKEISNQIIQAQSKLAAAKTRSQALQNQLALDTQQAVALSTLSQNAGVQLLLTEYQKLENQLAAERSRLTDVHPTVINLEQKTEALRQKLQEKIGKTINSKQAISEEDLQIGKLKEELTAQLVSSEIERLGLDNQIVQLNQSLLLSQQRLGSLPKLEKKQRELERKLQVAQATYQLFLKQLQEVRVIENQNVGNARIISLAVVPEKPVSSKKMLTLLGSGVLGLILGVILALTLELMDTSLKTIDEVKKILKYPVLGGIPQLKPKNNQKNDERLQDFGDLPVLYDPYSPATSAFEILETNLSFTSCDTPLKTIVVSSSVPGEGKSFTCANLAVTICQLGKRVLLIDADMRRPRQQDIWKFPNLKGLSNILIGQVSLEDTTQEALVSLDILTAGTIPPNPLNLLDSQQMSNFIKQASKKYDFIIIDAPPLTAVADPLKLNKIADGMLLVVRLGVGTTDSVTAAKVQLDQSGGKILGVAINGVTEKSSYGGYYNSKGYYGIKNESENKSKNKNENKEKELPNVTIS